MTYLGWIIVGLIIQAAGIAGFLFENKIEKTVELTHFETRIIDNDSGQMISLTNNGSHDNTKWKFVKRAK